MAAASGWWNALRLHRGLGDLVNEVARLRQGAPKSGRLFDASGQTAADSNDGQRLSCTRHGPASSMLGGRDAWSCSGQVSPPDKCAVFGRSDSTHALIRTFDRHHGTERRRRAIGKRRELRRHPAALQTKDCCFPFGSTPRLVTRRGERDAVGADRTRLSASVTARDTSVSNSFWNLMLNGGDRQQHAVTDLNAPRRHAHDSIVMG